MVDDLCAVYDFLRILDLMVETRPIHKIRENFKIVYEK